MCRFSSTFTYDFSHLMTLVTMGCHRWRTRLPNSHHDSWSCMHRHLNDPPYYLYHLILCSISTLLETFRYLMLSVFWKCDIYKLKRTIYIVIQKQENKYSLHPFVTLKFFLFGLCTEFKVFKARYIILYFLDNIYIYICVCLCVCVILQCYGASSWQGNM